MCLKQLEHPAYQTYIERRINLFDADLSSYESLDAWILGNLTPATHMSGTCKMGPASDPMAVIDRYCRVHGLAGLRVVETSVMPEVVRANATAIMIGERVADRSK